MQEQLQQPQYKKQNKPTQNKMEELTQEQIEKNILAAYDSVSLINELNSKEALTEEETDTNNRNVEHIKIMLSKEWFISALTETQKAELEAIVL
tara:strand:- start:1319 stop:1600 length:282 start_codon:yes stop_codon:yes gene_type:complete